MRRMAASASRGRRNLAIFTMIAEYAGGTYISQVLARDVEQAITMWKRRTAMGRRFRAAFECDEGYGSRPTPVRRMKNVWYHDALHDDKVVSLNIIKTAF
jgi:hypothetical protein